MPIRVMPPPKKAQISQKRLEAFVALRNSARLMQRKIDELGSEILNALLDGADVEIGILCRNFHSAQRRQACAVFTRELALIFLLEGRLASSDPRSEQALARPAARSL